jgi:urease accessory protein
MYSMLSKSALTLVLALMPALALAHSGHGEASGFAAGFLHPATGLDHLVAMLAVGIWSAQATRHVWRLPLAFAALLLTGAVFAIAGMGFPAIEPMIAASLLVIGLLLAIRAQLSTAVSVGLIGGFALFHGAAHGVELAAAANPALALAGMTLGTLLIHCVGLGIGRGLLRVQQNWTRALGGAVSLFGVGLLAGLA